MLVLIRLSVCLSLFPFLAMSGVQAVAAFPHKIISVESTKESEKDKKGPLQVGLQDMESGLKVSIQFDETKAKKPLQLPADLIGGDFRLFLDEIIVLHDNYKGPSLNVIREVPLLTRSLISRHCSVLRPGMTKEGFDLFR